MQAQTRAKTAKRRKCQALPSHLHLRSLLLPLPAPRIACALCSRFLFLLSASHVSLLRNLQNSSLRSSLWLSASPRLSPCPLSCSKPLLFSSPSHPVESCPNLAHKMVASRCEQQKRAKTLSSASHTACTLALSRATSAHTRNTGSHCLIEKMRFEKTKRENAP